MTFAHRVHNMHAVSQDFVFRQKLAQKGTKEKQQPMLLKWVLHLTHAHAIQLCFALIVYPKGQYKH